jgi:hypothetical protein
VLRLTLRHRFDFQEDAALVGDELLAPERWDALRMRTSGPFAIADTRAAHERLADAELVVRERARAISDRLEGFSSLASYGVGGAVLERWLERLGPERRLVLTDYAPETVDRLAALFPAATVVSHDLRADPPLAADVHLLHRVDTELDNREWEAAFERFRAETILYVVSEIAGLRIVARELRQRVRTRHSTRSGWLRTRSAFESLWHSTHDAEAQRFGDVHGWILTPHTNH